MTGDISIRPAAAGDIPTITRIYAHAVIHGTASFEIEPPDEAEMLRRQTALLKNGYPYFAALQTFSPVVGAPPAVGTCVIAQGTISSFRGSTQLSPATVTITSASDCGATALTPFVTTVAAIATDTDPVTTDNQPGPSAEALEGVLAGRALANAWRRARGEVP